MNLIKSSESVLLVVDIQEKLAPHIHQGDVVTQNTWRLIQTAIKLQLPVVVTEHYPKGLGKTVERLQKLMPKCHVFEKIHFSAASENNILQHLQSTGRGDVIVTGSETHVCVMQTALGLLLAGFKVWIVDDATSSRRAFDRRTALKRLNTAGIHSLSTEMLLFEWLGRGDNSAFKETLALIKNHGHDWQGTD